MFVLTLKAPDNLQLNGIYVYHVVHICDFCMLRVQEQKKSKEKGGGAIQTRVDTSWWIYSSTNFAHHSIFPIANSASSMRLDLSKTGQKNKMSGCTLRILRPVSLHQRLNFLTFCAIEYHMCCCSYVIGKTYWFPNLGHGYVRSCVGLWTYFMFECRSQLSLCVRGHTKCMMYVHSVHVVSQTIYLTWVTLQGIM